MAAVYNFNTGTWEDDGTPTIGWQPNDGPQQDPIDYLNSATSNYQNLDNLFTVDSGGTDIDWNSSFWDSLSTPDIERGDAGEALAQMFGVDEATWASLMTPDTDTGTTPLSLSGSLMASINRALGLGGASGTGTGAMTGNELGMGATGVLGLLAALTAKPSTSTQTGTSGSTGTTAGTSNTTGTQTGTNTSTGTTAGTSSNTGTQSGTTSNTGTVANTGSTVSTTGGPEWYRGKTESLADMLSGSGDSWSDLSGYITGGANDVKGEDLSGYMNPYIQSVLAPNLTRMQEDFLGQQNKRNANAAMVGAFGEERNVLDNSLAEERYDKNVSETTNTALSNAYNSAMQAFNADRSAQQWGAQEYGTLFNALRPEQTTAGTQANTGTTLNTGVTSGTTANTGATTGTTANTGTTTGTTTNTGATTGTTGTTQSNTANITGTDPNTFGQLTNLSANLFAMANPAQVR